MTHDSTPRPPCFLAFTVPGRARPQGSKRHVGNGRMVESSVHVASWRERVHSAGRQACEASKWTVTPDPIAVQLWVELRAPQSHRRRDGSRKPGAPLYPTGRGCGDADKLARAFLDALSGVVWVDDSQVVTLTVSKRWGDVDESRIAVRRA